MSADPTLNHEYLPLDGLRAFTDAASRLLLGDSSLAITQNRVSPIPILSEMCIFHSCMLINV